ncbi:DUF308 domain-containing protein [Bernardetia sp.]|uniref:DUF308 domain-containing protein n=1 Tax=Bernardetia sp. TaxID=1937974 RepID=UPI0025C5C4E0|nr:hypothetical protein [Bernardetia sp.]
MTIHTLEKEKHSDFLTQNRIDPITGDVLQEGDRVVICASCKSAFLADSWEYMGRRHCNQTYTLSEIPKQEIVKMDKETRTERLDRLAFFRFITVKESEASSIYTGFYALIGGILTLPSYFTGSTLFTIFGCFAIIVGIIIGKNKYKQKYLILDSGNFVINQGRKGEVIIPKEEIKTIEVKRANFFSCLANSFLFNKKEDFYHLVITTENEATHKVFISEHEVTRIKQETNILKKYASIMPTRNVPFIQNSPNGRIDLR